MTPTRFAPTFLALDEIDRFRPTPTTLLTWPLLVRHPVPSPVGWARFVVLRKTAVCPSTHGSRNRFVDLSAAVAPEPPAQDALLHALYTDRVSELFLSGRCARTGRPAWLGLDKVSLYPLFEPIDGRSTLVSLRVTCNRPPIRLFVDRGRLDATACLIAYCLDAGGVL